MKFRHYASVAWALAFFVATPLQIHAQDVRVERATRTLKGRVIEINSLLEVPGATVAVDGISASTSTDAHGRFILTGLPPSRLRLLVRAVGYEPLRETVDLADADRELLVRLRFQIVRLDSLVTTGRATDAGAELREAQATSRLDAEAMARQRGQTLGETLKLLPGVAVIQYGPSIAKPVVRGLHSQRIVVMNGAVPQEGQQWGAEHAPEIDAFAANDVEVIRGAGGVLYGSNALGGVVRVLPRPLPTAHGVAGDLQTNVFSNNRQGAASLLIEGGGLRVPLVNEVSWRAQGTVRRAGDAKTADYYLPNTGFEEIDWSGALGIRRAGGWSELSYSHFGVNLGMYSGAHIGNLNDLARAMDDPVTSDSFSYAIRRPDQDVKHDLISFRNRFGLGSTGKVDLDYGYQYNSRNEFDSHGPLSENPRPAFGLRLITHTLDARFSHAPLGRLAGTFGVSGIRQGNLSPGRSFLIPQYRLYAVGVYGLEQWSTDRWTVSAGLRYDYRWQHAYQFGAPVVISPDDVSSYSDLSGSLGVTYRIGDAWSIAATAGRMWRAPNVSERFSQGVHHGTAQYEIGDPSLGSERTVALDATLRHVGANSRLELSAYRNRIDDYIFLRPRAPIQSVRGAYPAYQYAATDAELRGLEASVQLDPARSLSLYASGTLVRGEDRNTGTPLFDIPADRLLVAARVYAPREGALKDAYLEVGSTLVRRQDDVPLNTVYSLPTDGYALLNAELGSGSLELLGRRWELSVSARNLLNTRYRDYLSRYRLFVDDSGRDLVLRLRAAFGKTGP
jgi:iron complex outermembrane receptor protein